MVRTDRMARYFAIIHFVACTYVELGMGQDIRRRGEVCNSRNLMLSIIHEVGTDVREDGSMSELDRNETSMGDIITKLIQHVEANSKTESESFIEISRAIRAEVQSLKACLTTEHDASKNGSESESKLFAAINNTLNRSTFSDDVASARFDGRGDDPLF